MPKILSYQLKMAVTALLIAVATPVKALEVEISPTTPQQGDTISVFVTTDNPNELPQVTLDRKSYPVFPVNNGYRALLPTSPLDPSGKLTIRITGDDTSKNIGVWLKNRSFPVQRITLSGNANRPATN